MDRQPRLSSLVYIETPLQVHPNKSSGADQDRTRKTTAPAGRPENQPFGHEVGESYGVRAECQLIDLWVRNVVGRNEPHNGRLQGPGAEGPAAKGCRGGSFCAFRPAVNLLSEVEGAVCLDGVPQGDDGNLAQD